jgi:N6-adenosine-specific RNA methylase IME4
MISLPDRKFDILYVDPPWQYGESNFTRKKSGKSGFRTVQDAEDHYNDMTLEQLKEIPVAFISAPNSLLFLWVSSPFLDQGIELMKAWGFKFKTVAFVWHKKALMPGKYTLSSCELCLVGKRGAIPQPRGDRTVRQFLMEKRTEHSRKPQEIRKRIERMFPSQSKIELFARGEFDGWEVWGNETNKYNVGLFE